MDPLKMEPEPPNGNIEALSITPKAGLVSAHTIDHDSWRQVGLLLVTGYSCGYILSFSNLMLVPLGWIWGIISLIMVAVFSAYSSWLLAGFHFVNGQRFIRYRDLMGSLFGKEMFYLTWVSQILILLLTNMGFILLGGKALKEISLEFGGSPLRLQYFIIITGVAYFVFSIIVPTMSSMGKWLIVSSVLTFAYIAILLVVVIKDDSIRSKYVCGRLEEWSKMYGDLFKPCGYLAERAAVGAPLITGGVDEVNITQFDVIELKQLFGRSYQF